MKIRNFLLLFFIAFASCTSQKNSEDFINNTSGRYLFNANEVLEVYYKEQVLYVKWRGNDNISPLKVSDSSFYMKELNEKMLFVSNPEMHIELAPKREHKEVLYHFKKMKKDEKTPGEYFAAKEFDKALNAFLIIQKKDSLNPVINQWALNRLGYDYVRQNDFDTAIEVFKINIALHPKSSNTYDSLGDAFVKNKDTTNAIINYKKALAINPENRSSKRMLKRITEK